MDSPGERDQTVERLLRQSLGTPQRGGVTDACLDAETLAAWTAGGLTGSALEAAQLHVADCARCQSMAGTLARLSSAVPQAEPVRSSRRWLAWFIPLTAAATAVALWFAVPGNPGAPATVAEPRANLGCAGVKLLRASRVASVSRARTRAGPACRTAPTGVGCAGAIAAIGRGSQESGALGDAESAGCGRKRGERIGG